jgi:hypothetical protein
MSFSIYELEKNNNYEVHKNVCRNILAIISHLKVYVYNFIIIITFPDDPSISNPLFFIIIIICKKN